MSDKASKEMFGSNPDYFIEKVLSITEHFAEGLGKLAANNGVKDMSSAYMLAFTRVVGASVKEEDHVIEFAENWLEYLKRSKEDGELEKWVADEEDFEKNQERVENIQNPDYIG